MRKILLTVLLAIVLLTALLPATSLAQEKDGFDGEFVHHEGKKYKGDVDWTPFFRDLDKNGVDDIIDEAGDGSVDIFVKLESLPTDEDVQLIEEFVPEIFYKAKYTNTIIILDVEKPLIYGKLRYLDRVTFIEYVCDIIPFLDVSAENIKAKPNDLYHDVWEELGIIGSGVNIAILDGGSNDHETTADVGHVSLNDMDDDPTTPTDFKFIAGWDFEIMAGGEAVNPHGDPLIGHGTHVAGTALGTGGAGEDSAQRGVAPGAQLVDVKTVSDAGFGGFLVQAIEWCIDNVDRDWLSSDTDGIQVMSMSLGTPSESDGSDTFSQTANQAVDAGMTVVVATGNDGNSGFITSPAAADKVIAVGATDDHNTVTRDDDTVAGYSNKGPRDNDGDSDPYDELKPDVVAPGSNIMAPRADSYGAFVAMSGTSMATPHVSGVVALMLEANPDLTPAQVKSILQASAEARGTPYNPTLSDKYNGAWGYGIVDAYRAVLMAQGYCDVEVEKVDVKNADEGKSRLDEGDDVKVTITLRDLEGYSDVETYTLIVEDIDTGTELERIEDSMGAGASKDHITQFRVNQGGSYNLSVSVIDVDPQDFDLSNNQKNTSFYVNYLPHADISANETDAMTLEEIRFDGGGSYDRDGTVKEYKFIFGDGEETDWVDEQVATHTYADDGDFYVRLLVKDNVSAESGSYSDQVRVNIYNRAPVADAGDDLAGEMDEELQFSGSGTDKDGEIALFEWDFDGDGTYDWSDHDSGETTYSYAEPGNYKAKFRVTDDDDVVDTDTINVGITGSGTENLPPIAEITEPEEGVVYFTDEDIPFNAGDSYDPDGSVAYYTWNSNVSGKLYDKGTKSQISLSITRSGHHNITLTVEDDKGETDSTFVKIFINAPPLVVIDEPEDEEVYQQNEIEFDASSTRDRDGDPLHYKWSSDIDGVLYEGEEPTFTTVLGTGQHTITLEVSDPYITKSKTIQIEIKENANSKPSAAIDDPSSAVVYSTDEKLFFNATSSRDANGDKLTYTWTSDIDGELYRGSEKTFEKKLSAGTHTITLTVSDGELSDDDSVELTVNEAPVADISSLKSGDTFFVGDMVTFDASGSYDPDSDAPLTYIWYINEEEVSQELSFHDHFEEGGKRDVILVVEDEYGFQSEASLTFYVISHSIMIVFPEYSSNTVRVNPGDTLTIQVEVENRASIDDHIELSPIQGQHAALSIKGPTEFSLGNSEKKIIDVEINVSGSAPEGRDEVGLFIIAGEGDYALSMEETLAVLIGDVLSFDISFSKSSVTIDAGATETLKIIVTNNGNGEAAFKISFDKIKNWKLKLSSSIFTIGVKESKEVTLTITAPDTIKTANISVTFTFESGDFTETRTLSIKAGKMSVGGGDDGGDDSPGFEGALIAVALVVVAFVVSKRKKRRGLER